MTKSKISATIVADSINSHGDRITSMEVVFPRFILAELNTHRAFSRNSASSRAIPFKKMVQMVQEDPFIPIAWQKDHKGMQGTEYFTDPLDIERERKDWLDDRNYAIKKAVKRSERGVTKQIVNRPLEPFMWHKVLITSTEWDNFFNLRCPQYTCNFSGKVYISRKDALNNPYTDFSDYGDLDWMWVNKGQAEIHMMALAEAVWDSMNESEPEYLEAGEWHIPYRDKIDYSKLVTLCPEDQSENVFDKLIIKIATGMAARVSYTTVGDEKEVSYETLVGIHDKMQVADPFHASPFEHCAQADPGYTSRNFRGFMQYREILETKHKII